MRISRLVAGLLTLSTIGMTAAGVGLTAPSSAVEQRVAAPAQKPFIVFDAMLYKSKPDLKPYNIQPLSILYEYRFWPDGSSDGSQPSEQLVRTLANAHRSSPEPVVIDIERWPLKGDGPTVRETVSRLMSVLSWFRSAGPELRVGLYGTIPVPDYWRAIRDPSSSEYRSWQQDNDRLGEIVPQVDALFPSVYTFYPDRQGWVTYAVAQMREARRKANGKPVYAFLMPRYHESNKLLGTHPLDPDYWDLELRTVYEHADGVVIWGGWGESWDENAPWWQVTKRFLSRIDTIAPAAPKDIVAQ